MTVRTKWIPALGFSVSALAVGVPYMLIPYRELNLPSALYGPELCVLVDRRSDAWLWRDDVLEERCDHWRCRTGHHLAPRCG